MPVFEPYVVQQHLDENRSRVRKLLRRNQDFRGNASKPNELAWTDDIVEIPTKNGRSVCHVRFFSSKSKLPTPYDRADQADFFFISSQRVQTHNGPSLEDLNEPFPEGINVGFDPSKELKYPLLSTLSLFPGRGNFDRGLEEGDAVRARWAGDWDRVALHTYRANSKEDHPPALFLRSIDEYMYKAISGSDSSLIAKIGEVLAIASGSPGQGISVLQQNVHSNESILNVSKVASGSSSQHWKRIDKSIDTEYQPYLSKISKFSKEQEMEQSSRYQDELFSTTISSPKRTNTKLTTSLANSSTAT